MTRRNIELALLCIAAPLAILLFAMIALNQGEELGWASIGVPVGIFASFIVSHLALRKFAPAGRPRHLANLLRALFDRNRLRNASRS